MAGRGKKGLTKLTVTKYKKVIDQWFINGFNGKDAYLKIYPKVTAKTAMQNFHKIQNHPEMQGHINSKHQEAKKYVTMTHEGILQELQNWVESDITETIGLTGEQLKELPPQIRRLINKYKRTLHKAYSKEGELLGETEFIELSFVSKEMAIREINKHIGFYVGDNKQKEININLGTLTTEELKERANEIKKITKR